MADFLKPKETLKIPEIKPTPEQQPMVAPETTRAPVPEQAEAGFEAIEQDAREQNESPKYTVYRDDPNQHVEPLAERVQTVHTKSERLVAIERVMSDGLGEMYMSLAPAKQQELKKSGEAAAHKIEALLESGAAVAKKVLQVLRNWLAKIPGINAYFLEQESKLKTDRIMAIARKGRE